MVSKSALKSPNLLPSFTKTAISLNDGITRRDRVPSHLSPNWFEIWEKCSNEKKDNPLIFNKLSFDFRDPGGIRTHDPQLRRLLLYPAELPDRSLYSFVLLGRFRKWVQR